MAGELSRRLAVLGARIGAAFGDGADQAAGQLGSSPEQDSSRCGIRQNQISTHYPNTCLNSGLGPSKGHHRAAWETVGWAGATAILSVYLAISMGRLKAGKGFQTANLFGAVVFIINGTIHGRGLSW